MRPCRFKPGDRVTIVDQPSMVMDGVDPACILFIARHGAIVEDTHFDPVSNSTNGDGWWTVDLKDHPYIFMEEDLKPFDARKGQPIRVQAYVHDDSKTCPGCGVEDGERHNRGCREIGC